MRTEFMSHQGNYVNHDVVIDNRPEIKVPLKMLLRDTKEVRKHPLKTAGAASAVVTEGVKARVGDFFRDREAAKELLKLSRQVSDANGTLPSFSGRNSHQEPRNPQRPHDQEWTEADVWKGLSYWAWYPRFLTPLGLSISVPLLKVSYLTSKQVDNRVSNEKDESGRSIHTRYATTERGVGIVHIGRLVLGTTSRSTTRRINGHREKQDVSYSREITAYDTNAAQMIRDFRYAIENDQDSLPNRAKRKKAERKMRRSDRWYAVRHAHLREALKRKPYTYK